MLRAYFYLVDSDKMFPMEFTTKERNNNVYSKGYLTDRPRLFRCKRYNTLQHLSGLKKYKTPLDYSTTNH